MRAYKLVLAAWALAGIVSAQAIGSRTVRFTAGGKTLTEYSWFPGSNSAVAPEQHPVIVFAHGFCGTATQSLFIVQAFAADGYIVIATNYDDAAGVGCYSHGSALGSISNTVYRYNETEALLSHFIGETQAGGFFAGAADLSKLGCAGHSLGGQTCAGLVGAYPAYADSRFIAALLFAPYVQPLESSSWTITTPVMIQGGSNDTDITPTLQPFYDRLAGPKYFLVLNGANHLAWTNMDCSSSSTSPMCAAIVHYGESFLGTYVAGTSIGVDTMKASTLTSYEFQR